MAQTVILMMNEKIDIIKSFLWIYKITKRKIDMCRKRFHSHTHTHTHTHTHKPKNRQIFLTQHSQSLQSQDYKTQQQQQQLPWLFVFCCFSGWSLLLLNAASVRCCRCWCWLYSGSRAGTLLIDFAVLGITVACVTTISSSCGFLCGAVQAFVPGKLFVKFLFTVVLLVMCGVMWYVWVQTTTLELREQRHWVSTCHTWHTSQTFTWVVSLCNDVWYDVMRDAWCVWVQETRLELRG